MTHPPTTTYRTICAWCGRDLGPAPAGCTADAHGICRECKEKMMRDRSRSR